MEKELFEALKGLLDGLDSWWEEHPSSDIIAPEHPFSQAWYQANKVREEYEKVT